MTRHRYIYGNDNPVSYVDPSGEFFLADIGAMLGIMSQLAAGAFLSGVGAAAISTTIGLAAGAISGFTKWDGYYLQVSPSLPAGISSAFIPVLAESEPMNGYKIVGTWALFLAGLGPSFSPISGLGGTFHAISPTGLTSLTGANILGGPAYYSDVTFVPGVLPSGTLSNLPPYSSAFFTMGFGTAWAAPDDTTYGFSIDISQLVGISVPLKSAKVRVA